MFGKRTRSPRSPPLPFGERIEVRGGCSRRCVIEARFVASPPPACPLTPTLSPKGRGGKSRSHAPPHGVHRRTSNWQRCAAKARLGRRPPLPRRRLPLQASAPHGAAENLPMDQLDDVLNQDLDPTETREGIDSLSAVISHDGTERAPSLLEQMVDSPRRAGGYLPFAPTPAYVNPIAPANEAKSPGDAAMEWR